MTDKEIRDEQAGESARRTSAAEAPPDADADMRRSAADVADSVIEGRDSEEPDADVRTELEANVVEALKTVYDPEIPINVYDLGLIYEIRVNDDLSVYIKMTLTAPNCPAAEMLPQQVEYAAANVPQVTDVRVQLTFDPSFTPEMMSEEARLTLGFM